MNSDATHATDNPKLTAHIAAYLVTPPRKGVAQPPQTLLSRALAALRENRARVTAERAKGTVGAPGRFQPFPTTPEEEARFLRLWAHAEEC